MNQVTPQVFNRARIRRAFDRAADSYEGAAVLQYEVCQRLLEKLEIVKINPALILDAGAGTGMAIPGLFRRYKKADVVALDLSEKMLQKTAARGSFFRKPQLVCADIEQLPFAECTFDLVFSSLTMQWCNDLDAVFGEAKRVLKPGGLYVFTTFGPDTLKELRYSWGQVDDASHVNRFIDMHDIGDALLQHGFAEPVMEAEVITVTYDEVDQLMHDLKAIGANVTADMPREIRRGSGLTGKAALQTVRRTYEKFRQNNVLPASYEIIYGHAWKAQSAGPDSRTGSQCKVEFER